MQQHGSNYFARRPLHTLSPTPPRQCGWGQKIKIQLFQNMVMLHINLKRIMYAATW